MSRTTEIVGEIAALIREKGYEMDEIVAALEVVKAQIVKGFLEGLSR